MSVEEYNRTNGDSIDISADVISVEPGNIDSYGTLPEMTEAHPLYLLSLNSYWSWVSSPVVPPLHHSNASIVELSNSYETEAELQFGFSLGLSTKACTPDASGINPSICVGLESEDEFGQLFSWSRSESSIFSSTITGVDLDHYFTNNFETGLYVYGVTLADPVTGVNSTFPVVNYYLNR